MDLTNFETDFNSEIYDEMSKTFEKLIDLADSEKTDFQISEKEALKLSQQAFENYLKAELIYQQILVHPVSGNALTNIQRYILNTMCRQRIEKMKESIEYHGFE